MSDWFFCMKNSFFPNSLLLLYSFFKVKVQSCKSFWKSFCACLGTFGAWIGGLSHLWKLSCVSSYYGSHSVGHWRANCQLPALNGAVVHELLHMVRLCLWKKSSTWDVCRVVTSVSCECSCRACRCSQKHMMKRNCAEMNTKWLTPSPQYAADSCTTVVGYVCKWLCIFSTVFSRSMCYCWLVSKCKAFSVS